MVRLEQYRTPENPTVETNSVAEGAVLTNRSLAQNSLLAGILQGVFAVLQGIYGDLRLLVFVAEAVRYNLSQGKFPDNREFNREFFDFRPFSVILARNRCAKSMACSKIPYESEQGIFFAEQGIFWSEQGISGKGRAQDRGWIRRAGRTDASRGSSNNQTACRGAGRKPQRI